MLPESCLLRLIWALRWILVFLGGVLFLNLSGAQPAFVGVSAGQGFVEAVEVDSEKRTLTVSGWAAPQNSNVFVTTLLIDVAGSEIYRGRFERSERTDVAKATGLNDWLWTGFKLVVSIPDSVPNGSSSIKFLARLGDGESFEVTTPAPSKILFSTPQVQRAFGDWWHFISLWHYPLWWLFFR